MLFEPVLVSTRRETIPSHLLIVVDDSESMRFSDPYTDNSRAADIAAELEAGIGRRASRPSTGCARRPGSTWSRRSSARTSRRWRAAGSCSSTTWSRRPSPGGGAGARRASSTRSSRTAPYSPLGDALHGVLAAHRGQPVAGVILATDGRSNTGEDPLRAVEAAARQNIPIFSDRRRGRRGPAQRPARRDRGQPGRLRARPDDAGRRGRGPRPAATPRPTIVLEQRINDGAWEQARQPAGRAGRGRHPQADDVPDHAPGGRPVRVPRPGRGRRPRADPGRQRRRRPRCGSSASRSASC